MLKSLILVLFIPLVGCASHVESCNPELVEDPIEVVYACSMFQNAAQLWTDTYSCVNRPFCPYEGIEPSGQAVYECIISLDSATSCNHLEELASQCQMCL